jgi:hypothetical protein
MENNSQADRRFRYYHYYFFIGGVPLFNTSVSIFYHMFVLLCYVCAYSMIFAMIMDIYHHKEDLDEVMDVITLLLSFLATSYTQLYFR